jgi:anti-anti-sigma factor
MADQSAADNFAIRNHDAPGGASVIVVSGELDLATSPQLLALASRLDARAEPVILDLSAVTFVDSSGVRALLDADRIAGDKGRRLALYQPSIAVTRLLDLVDLRSRFPEVQSLDDRDVSQLVAPDA